jgi:hypothetical protein
VVLRAREARRRAPRVEPELIRPRLRRDLFP